MSEKGDFRGRWLAVALQEALAARESDSLRQLHGYRGLEALCDAKAAHPGPVSGSRSNSSHSAASTPLSGLGLGLEGPLVDAVVAMPNHIALTLHKGGALLVLDLVDDKHQLSGKELQRLRAFVRQEDTHSSSSTASYSFLSPTSSASSTASDASAAAAAVSAPPEARFKSLLALSTVDSVVVSMQFLRLPGGGLRLLVTQQNGTFLVWEWRTHSFSWEYISRGVLPVPVSPSSSARSGRARQCIAQSVCDMHTQTMVYMEVVRSVRTQRARVRVMRCTVPRLCDPKLPDLLVGGRAAPLPFAFPRAVQLGFSAEEQTGLQRGLDSLLQAPGAVSVRGEGLVAAYLASYRLRRAKHGLFLCGATSRQLFFFHLETLRLLRVRSSSSPGAAERQEVGLVFGQHASGELLAVDAGGGLWRYEEVEVRDAVTQQVLRVDVLALSVGREQQRQQGGGEVAFVAGARHWVVVGSRHATDKLLTVRTYTRKEGTLLGVCSCEVGSADACVLPWATRAPYGGTGVGFIAATGLWLLSAPRLVSQLEGLASSSSPSPFSSSSCFPLGQASGARAVDMSGVSGMVADEPVLEELGRLLRGKAVSADLSLSLSFPGQPSEAVSIAEAWGPSMSHVLRRLRVRQGRGGSPAVLVGVLDKPYHRDSLIDVLERSTALASSPGHKSMQALLGVVKELRARMATAREPQSGAAVVGYGLPRPRTSERQAVRDVFLHVWIPDMSQRRSADSVLRMCARDALLFLQGHLATDSPHEFSYLFRSMTFPVLNAASFKKQSHEYCLAPARSKCGTTGCRSLVETAGLLFYEHAPEQLAAFLLLVHQTCPDIPHSVLSDCFHVSSDSLVSLQPALIPADSLLAVEPRAIVGYFDRMLACVEASGLPVSAPRARAIFDLRIGGGRSLEAVKGILRTALGCPGPAGRALYDYAMRWYARFGEAMRMPPRAPLPYVFRGYTHAIVHDGAPFADLALSFDRREVALVHRVVDRLRMNYHLQSSFLASEQAQAQESPQESKCEREECVPAVQGLCVFETLFAVSSSLADRADKDIRFGDVRSLLLRST